MTSNLDIPTLVARHGDDMALPEIGQRLRCQSCGAKVGGVQVMKMLAFGAGERALFIKFNTY